MIEQTKYTEIDNVNREGDSVRDLTQSENKTTKNSEQKLTLNGGKTIIAKTIVVVDKLKQTDTVSIQILPKTKIFSEDEVVEFADFLSSLKNHVKSLKQYEEVE